MANELRVRQNFLGGLVRDDPLADTDTYFNSDSLPAMVAIGSTQYLPVILDPDGVFGEPEIVYVTEHLAADEAAQISRGMEGTTAREHPVDTSWVHGPTSSDWPAIRSARAYRAAALNIPNDVWTPVDMDTEVWDTDAIHDTATNPSRFILNKIGYWMCTGFMSFAANSSNRRGISIAKNGTIDTQHLGPALAATGASYVGMSQVIYSAAVTDYVQFQAFQDSGGTLAIGAAASATHASVTYLGV